MSRPASSASSFVPHSCNVAMTDRKQIDHDLVVDQLGAMLYQEDRIYSDHIDFDDQERPLKCSNGAHNDVASNETSRSRICEWAFKVVDHFGYEREVVGICMNYIDRYISSLKNSGTRLPTRDYQILSATSLYLAVKLHGKVDDRYASGKELQSIHTFVTLSRGVATKEIIEEMERSILSSLRWRMNPPIPSYFVSYLLELFPTETMPRRMVYDLAEISRYLTELSVCTSVLSNRYRPSLVAFACILNATSYVEMTIIPRDAMRLFLETVAKIVFLRPEMAEVQEVRGILKGLTSPDIFGEEADCNQVTRCPAPLSPEQTNGGHGYFDQGSMSPDCVSGMRC